MIYIFARVKADNLKIRKLCWAVQDASSLRQRGGEGMMGGGEHWGKQGERVEGRENLGTGSEVPQKKPNGFLVLN